MTDYTPTTISPTDDADCFVKLISADGFEFILSRKCAMNSGTIRNMLSSSGQFSENLHNEITFGEIKAIILEKVCQYLQYKARYSDPKMDIPEFQIEPELALELLMAADFLDC